MQWDACLDLSLRRFVYSSVVGAFSGLLLFRSPVTRWASVALSELEWELDLLTQTARIYLASPQQL
ncbi:hypothetical protein RND81_09G105600 [Saponaria officinalis]|uniref:Uncharacterized protein n=1 Tax=Saponaria officinalis TaxID=3572 RepID=A0AAW1ILA5_SAPOF